jgi:hypothetical protein
MSFGIESNIEKVATRWVGGALFADVALQEAIDSTLRKGKEIAEQNISVNVYMHEGSPEYERTYTLYHSVRASKFFATGGQVYLSKQAFRKRYYPRYVDEGTMYMEGRDFWAPTVEELKAVLEANMLVAAETTARMLTENA